MIGVVVDCEMVRWCLSGLVVNIKSEATSEVAVAWSFMRRRGLIGRAWQFLRRRTIASASDVAVFIFVKPEATCRSQRRQLRR